MNLFRSLLLGGAAVIVLGSGVLGQSPSPAPSVVASGGAATSPPPVGASPLPSLSPRPSATPVPRPVFPLARPAPGTLPAGPRGKPDASTTDRGVRLELWLSTTTAAPGDWVVAIVRATNVGDGTVWVRTGDRCHPRTLTSVEVDLSTTTPMGVEQSGEAAAFKARLLRHALTDRFRLRRTVREGPVAGARVSVWAECTFRPTLLTESIPPGGTRTERFRWRAASPVDFGPKGWMQPQFPGTAPVTVAWAFGGRGARPSQQRLAGWFEPIRMESAIELTGDGPGVPSYPELIDAALADPSFGPWIEANPFEEGWVVWRSNLRGPAYSAYLGRDRILEDRAPDGAVELFIGRGTRVNAPSLDPRAAVYVHPWTGAVIATWFRESPAPWSVASWPEPEQQEGTTG